MIRRIIMLQTLMLLIGIQVANCQDTINHFIVERNNVVWRKTFQTPMNQDQLFYKIKESGVFTIIERQENNNLIGELRGVKPDCVGAGYTFISSRTYLDDRFLNGFVVVEIKEGRYRVTLKKITLSKKSVDSLHMVPAKEFIEDEAFKFEKKEFSQSFIKSGSKILDHTFTQLFDFNDMVSDEW